MTTLPFWGHVEELRKTLIRSGSVVLLGTFLALCFYKTIFKFLIAPLSGAFHEGLSVKSLFIINPLEGVTSTFKISFWAGVLISSPLWLFYISNFFLPALRERGRALIFFFGGLSLLFLYLGILVAYKVTLPIIFSYCYRFNNDLGQNAWSLSQTINLILNMLFVHAFIFELYVVLMLLVFYKIISYQTLKNSRKFIIVFIFILAAIVTPPDLFSQLLLAFPMIFLLESVIILARYRSKMVN